MSFKKGSLAVFLLLAALMVLGGCGGGGGGGSNDDPANLTGKFIDGPVLGLGYSCSPSGLAGTTNSSGEFKYKAGDDVKFFLGKDADALFLPSVRAESRITPLNYYPNETIEGENVIKMVRFVMSAGVVSSTGGIALRANPFPAHGGEYNAAKWDALNNAGLITVSEEDAKRHFDPNDATDSKLNGTWKITKVSVTYTAYPPAWTEELVPTKLTPETFPMRLLYDGVSTYTINVNHYGSAEWEWEYEEFESASVPAAQPVPGLPSGQVFTQRNLKKIGTGEKYERKWDGRTVTIELTGEDTCVVTDEWPNSENAYSLAKMTLTRMK